MASSMSKGRLAGLPLPRDFFSAMVGFRIRPLTPGPSPTRGEGRQKRAAGVLFLRLPGGALLLLVEQGALALQAPAVAAQRAVAADDAVAGDDDRNRVGGAGPGHGAGGGRLADGAGDLLVSAGSAVGDGAQLLPDAPLEGGRADVQGQVEV